MNTLYLILLILGAVCFFLSAASFDVSSRRVNFLALGLLFWIAVPLIQTIKVM